MKELSEKARSLTYRLLRRSEKYIKTDMVYLAKGGFWITLGQIVSTLSVFFLAIAFANLVPPETYGTYKYLLSIAGIFAIFTLPGMSTAIARAVARGDTATIHAATRARVLWSLLGTLVAFVGSAYYFLNGNIELTIALAIIGITLPVFDTFTLYGAYLTGTHNFRLQTIFHLISQGISVTSLITTLFLTDNVLLILLAYFLPLSLIRFVLHAYTSRFFTSDVADKETLSYGKHLSLISVLGTIAGNIDKIILWKFLGPAQVAIYAFALAIPEQIKGPLKGFADLAFPKFAKQTPEQIHKNVPAIRHKLTLYALLLFLMSVLYILTAPYIFKILFPQYIESVFYSQVFSISLITGITTILSQLLAAQKKVKAQYIFNTLQPLTTITLYLILIPIFGVLGAILAFVAGRFISLGILMMIVKTVFSSPLQNDTTQSLS